MSINIENVDKDLHKLADNVSRIDSLIHKIHTLLGTMDGSQRVISDINGKISEIKAIVEKEVSSSAAEMTAKNEKFASQMVTAVRAMESLLEELQDKTLANFEDNIKVLVQKSFEANKKILEALNDRVTTITDELAQTANILDKDGVEIFKKTASAVKRQKLTSYLTVLLLIVILLFQLGILTPEMIGLK